jgi:hypothetical protein
MMAKKPAFNLANYIRNQNMPGQLGGAAAGQWGIPDPAGTARGRLAQFRRGLVGIGAAQSTPEQWAMQSKPGEEMKGIASGMKAMQDAKAAKMAAIQKRHTDMVSSNIAAGFSTSEIGPQYTEQDRLSDMKTEGRTGWTMDEILEYRRGEGSKYDKEEKFARAMRSPAEEIAYNETIQDKYNVVDQALWDMALGNKSMEYTDIGSLPGVNYDANGQPIIKTQEDQDNYNKAVNAASQDPNSNAIEKYGLLKAYYWAWNTSGNEDWSSLQDLQGLGVNRSDEGKALVSQYKNFMIDKMAWEGIPNNIINMAFNTKSPMPFAAMVAAGFLKVGQSYPAWYWRAFGYDLLDTFVSGKVVEGEVVDGGAYPVYDANGKPIPGASQNVPSAGIEWTTGPVPEVELTDKERLDALVASGMPSPFGMFGGATGAGVVPQDQGGSGETGDPNAAQIAANEATGSTAGFLPDPGEKSRTGTFFSDGEEFRSGRDWTTPQILSVNEVKYYFDADGQIEPGLLTTVQEIDGKLTIISQSLNGWTTNYGADGVNTWTSPDGEVFNSQEEITAHENIEVEKAATAELTGGNAGAVFNEFRQSSPYRDSNAMVYYPTGFETIPGTLTPAGFKAGMALVPIGVPTIQESPSKIVVPAPPVVGGSQSAWTQGITPSILPSQSTLTLTPTSGEGEFKTYEYANPIVVDGVTTGLEIVSNGIDGNTNAGDVLASYTGLPQFDDANLPAFIVKSGNGYTVDISQDAGKVFLMAYYPDQFLRLIWSQGKTTANTKLLQEDFGMTDQEVSDWFKGKPYGFKDAGPSEFQQFTSSLLSLLQAPNEIFADVGAAIFSIGGDEADRNDIENIHNFLQTGGIGMLAPAFSGVGFTSEAAVLSRLQVTNVQFSSAMKVQSALSATSLMGTSSGMEGWASLFTPFQVTGKYLYAQANKTTDVDARVFLQNLASSIEDKGFGALFNVRTREALANYDVPMWLDGVMFGAEMLVPIGGFTKIGRMPAMLKTVRTGTTSFVRSIRTVEDFVAAASMNGWRVQRSIKGRFILWTKDRAGKEVAIPIKNLSEADSFFKFGTPYKLRPARMRAIEKAILAPIKRVENWTDFVTLAKANKWGVRFAVTGIDKAVTNVARKVYVKIDKELIEINSIEEANTLIRNRAFRERVAALGQGNVRITIDGREIPLFTMPSEAEILIDTLKNQPGRLGLGLLKLVQAKLKSQGMPKLTIEDIKKMTNEELSGVTRELVQEGKVALDTIYRASNIINIRCEAAAKEMTDLLKSQLNTKEGDRLLKQENGDLIAGQVLLHADAPAELTARVGKNGLWAAHDVAEYWKYFTFLKNAPEITRWFSNIDELLRGLEQLGLQEGVINKAFRRYRTLEAQGIYRSYFPRTIIGQEGMEEIVLKSEEDFLKKRTFVDAVEGRDLGLHYATLGKSIDSYIDTFYNKLVMKKTRAFIIRSGLTIPKIWETAEGLTLMQTAKATAKRAGQVKIIDRVIRHIYGPAGKEIPAGGRMAWINENFPDLADRIKKLVYYSSDSARRDVLHSLQNRMRVRKLILQNEIRNIKTADIELVDIPGGVKGLKVYHGTQEGLPKKIEGAMYYTDSYGEAAAYAGADFSKDFTNIKNIKGDVGEYYITLRNPKILGTHDKYFTRASKYSKDKIDELKAQGYDGVIMPGESGIGKNYVVFDAANVSNVAPKIPNVVKSSIISELYNDTVKLRTAEERINEILDSLTTTGVLTDANKSYLQWFSEWTQQRYPEAFRWYKNWNAEPGATHLVTLKGFYDDVVDLRKSLADEIAWFSGMTEIQRAARLSDPLAIMGRLEEANGILNKIWRIDKPGQTIEQLRKVLDGVFPGEFTGRLDDLVSIFDKSKVRGIYESLEADVQKLLDESEKAKTAAAIDRKAAEDATATGAKTHKFEDEGRTGATFDRVFGEIKVNGKIVSGKAVREKIERIYTDKANPLVSGFAQFTQAMLPLQLAMDFSFATIQGAPMLGLEAVLNFKALVNGEAPSFIWAEAMKYSIGQTFSGMAGRNILRSFRNKHIDVYDRKLGKGLLINDATDYFASVGWIGKNIEKISNKNVRRPLEFVIAPYAGFQSGFSAWSEVSRVLLIEKLETSWYRAGGTEAELARFANAITGSMAEPGRSAAQRVSESALFLAPRFYRANLFMLNRMLPKFKTGGARGMTGKMMAESIIGMYASFNAAYIALCYAVGQSPKLNPLPKSMGGNGAEAYTIEVDGQMIGIPGLWFSGSRAMISAAAIGLANPDKIFSIDWENLKDSSIGTLLSFATDRQSLALSFIEEMATGKAYGGIRLEDSNDYLKAVGEQFIPIAWRSLLEGDNKPSTYYAWGANILGFRNWQQNSWIDYYEAFDEFLTGVPDSYLTDDQLLKRGEGKLTTNDLMSWQIDKIKLENPDLMALWEVARAAQLKRETDEERAYRLDHEQYDKAATDATNLACADLRDTTNNLNAGAIVTTKDLSDRVNEISAERSTLSGDLRRRYSALFASFDEQWLADKETAPQFEIAMNDYYDNVVNGAGNTDEYGNFVMENYLEAKAKWIQDWGPEFYSYLIEVKRYGLMDQDPLILKMWEAKESLGAYWAVAKEDREAFLENPANVEYDANLIFMGYTTVIHNPAAEALVRQWCADLNINADVCIPALTKLLIPAIMLSKYEGLDANDLRAYNSLPTSGYARERFIIDHPAFKVFVTNPEDGFLKATVNGQDPYTWDSVATVHEEELLNLYDAVPDSTPSQQLWRCTYPAGDAALVKFRGMSPMDPDKCRVILGSTSSQAGAGLLQ